MKRFALTAVLCLGAAARAHAAAYFEQASLPAVFPATAGMDRDSLGNLYVLGRPDGSSTYWVAGFRTPEMAPLFSFDTGVSTPAAFAVEASGIIDVVDSSRGAAAIELKRFQNTGYFIGKTTYSINGPYDNNQLMAAAIDRTIGRLYLTYQRWVSYYCLQCLGCSCPPSGIKGFVQQYDFAGNLLKVVNLPGLSATAGSCYTPSYVAADPNGDFFIADNTCQHVLKYSQAGSLVGDWAGGAWNSGYQFQARGMWTDERASLYINQPVCGASGCQPGVVKLDGSANLLTKMTGDSNAGCAWDERILYLGGPASAPLRRAVNNTPPSVPAETYPIGPVVQHSSSAILAWQFASDTEGDSVLYAVALGTSPLGLAPLGSTLQQSLETAPLAFETTYYWQVVAQDQYQGLPLQQRQAPVVSFRLSLQNSPPGTFSVLGGTGTVVTRDATVRLTWQKPSDPDGDPLAYDVFWRPSTGAVVQIATTTATSLTVGGLAFGATYYWSVRARDVYGLFSWLAAGQEQPYTAVFANEPPGMPAILGGAGVSSQHTLSPQAKLSWSAVYDPNGDAVAYRVFVGTSAQALAPVQDSTSTSFSLASPSFGTTYYWQVAAYDPYGGAAATPAQTLLVQLANSAPAAPVPQSGAGALATRETSQILSWSRSFDPDGDPVIYDLALSTAPGIPGLVQSSTSTAFSLSFQFGTTYYWQATARDGFGGTAESGLQTFMPTFRNSAPSAPVNLSKTGAVKYHGFDPSLTLLWDDSFDPDGDAFGYEVYFGTSSSGMAELPPVLYGDAVAGLSVNTTYYYRIVARDVFGAASASPVNSIYFQFSNQAPAAFSILGATGTVTTRDTSVGLSWKPSSDGDGDPVAYRLYAGTSLGGMTPAADTEQTLAVLGGLAFGSTYYWRVEAYDGFGGTTPASGGTQSFHLAFRNSPPSPLVYLSTASVYNLHTASPAVTLAWRDSADLDGDPVDYRLDVRTSTGDWPAAGLGAATSFTLKPIFETTYYWRVTASDPFGGVATGTWTSFVAHFANQPPAAIICTSTPVFVTRETSYALSWRDTGDPDGDSYAYSLYLSTDPGRLVLAQAGAPTSFALSFQFGATYYWQVSAQDSFGATATGPVQAFLPVFKNAPPAAPSVTGGAAALSQHALSPQATLSWNLSWDPDGDAVGYRVFFGTSAQGATLVQDGPGTTFSVPSPQFGTTYYWQVSAYDPYGAIAATPVQTLLIQLANAAPSSPQPRSGTGSLATRETSQLLSWWPSLDADGDMVTYDLALSTKPGSLALVQSSTATSYALVFQFGATYYWQVTARDGFGGVAQSGLQTFAPSFRNSAPTVPGNLSRTGTIPFHGFSPSLSFFWQDSADADGDAFSYALFFGTDPGTLTRISPASLGHTIPNLSVNTAYYYRIVATDIYGASSESPVNWVYFQFSNQAPAPFSVLATSGSVVTRQTSVGLVWIASSDADGDPLGYRVYAGTSIAGMTLAVDTIQTSSLLSGLAFGSTYYWRVEAYDGFGGTTPASGGTQSFHLAFRNSPPSPLVYLSTASVYNLHTASPAVTLAWRDSADLDGDSVSYRLEVRTSTGDWPAAELGTATSFTLEPLFETTYYWRIAASDPFGGVSTGAWASFAAHFVNQPPAAIVYTSTPVFVTRDSSYGLSWRDTGDPDGDAYAYNLYLSTDPGRLVLAQEGKQNSYALSFQFGTTYYWQVSARDSFGAVTTGAVQTFLPVFKNAAPAAPAVTGGAGTLSQHTLSPQAALSWSLAWDPDGDAVGYRVLFGTSAQSAALVQIGEGRTFSVPNPQFGTTYYWQVAAYDPFGGVAATPMQTLLIQLANAAPSAPQPRSGTGSLATRETTQLLSWSPSFDADGDSVTYDLTLSTKPGNLELVQSSTATSYTLGFQSGTTYYWQVTARDGFVGAADSGLQTFAPSFRNSSPTVPGNLSKTGTIQFHGFSPSLSFFWQDSADQDGDGFSYSLFFGTDPGTLTRITSASLGHTIPNLSVNTAYYYRIVATDIYGASSESPVDWVYFQFSNQAPASFSILGTNGSVVSRETSVGLAWTASSDADGDLLGYRLYAGTSLGGMTLAADTLQTSALLSGLAFGSTYYWRVEAYDGFGGTTPASGGTQSFHLAFRNSPPAPMVYLSTASVYSLHTSSPAVSLSWRAPVDADGDPVSNRLEVRTSTSEWAAELAGATSFALEPLFETTYYWRIVASDPYGGVSTGPWASLVAHFVNQPPTAVVYTSTSVLVTRADTYALSWKDTGDPDGDGYLYSLYLSTDPSRLDLAQRGALTSYNLAFQFATTYYWQIRVADSFGAVTSGPVQTLLPVFRNAAPPAPAASGGAGILAQHTLSPQANLSWSPVADPDGDAVGYRLFVGTSAGGLALAQDGPGTAYSLPSPQFGTTYYWQVSAYDPYGGAAALPVQTTLVQLRNTAPAAFGSTSGTGTLVTREKSVSLGWEGSPDSDADLVAYGLRLSTEPAALPLVSLSTAPGYRLAFDYGTTYYWLVEAYDGFGATTTITGGVRTFLPVFLNDPPEPLALAAPFKGSPVVSTMKNGVELSWERVRNPQDDPIAYTVYLGESPDSLQVVTRIDQQASPAGARVSTLYSAAKPQSQVELDGETIRLRLNGLDYYRSYYFRLEASNPYGAKSSTPLQTFSLSALSGFPKAYNYPNPFSPGRGGTRIVFNAPPSGYSRATVSVYSEFQDLLYRREFLNIAPGVSEVAFDGRDRYGRALFNGSYICHVRFEGPEDKETFYLMVVK